MATVSLRFVHQYDPRDSDLAKPRDVVLASIPLPASFQPTRKALVGVAGRTASAVAIAKLTNKSPLLAFSVKVEVTVNRIPVPRIGWDELRDPKGEPFEFLPLHRLRNDALVHLLELVEPGMEGSKDPPQTLLRSCGTQLDRLASAVRVISPATKVATFEVGQGEQWRPLGLLLSSDGAEIQQPGNHPFRFRFPAWLSRDRGAP